MIASVRDQNKINDLFAYYHPDIVYHAAAHKHVPLMEMHHMKQLKIMFLEL